VRNPAPKDDGPAGASAPKSELRPFTLLISALGGEGGGVLTSWIVNAARACDLPVQATSIPGVAQRTGATTYYIEIWPQTWAVLQGLDDSGKPAGGDQREPVLALAPTPGEVDVFIASELLEAGRAIRGGFITPHRTLLITSTHRVYTTAEKMQMGDGRYDSAPLAQAASSVARAHIALDLAALAEETRAPLNAVLLGALAGAAGLPIDEAAFREGIRTEGKAADSNLRGFKAGLEGVAKNKAREHGGKKDSGESASQADIPQSLHTLLERARTEFPEGARELIAHGVRRTVDFQDTAYGTLYLERLAPFPALDADHSAGGEGLTAAVARHLALRMTFDDVFRVAQAKSRPERLLRIRAETGALPGEHVEITEFLKPGWSELCDSLPEIMARPLEAWGKRRPALKSMRWGMELRSTTVWGYLRLRGLAALRIMRRATSRYRREQAAIDRWLAWVQAGAVLHPRLGLEIAGCARLLKGYGETHRRGERNFAAIAENLIRPALERKNRPVETADAIGAACKAALADPEGRGLDALLQG